MLEEFSEIPASKIAEKLIKILIAEQSFFLYLSRNWNLSTVMNA